MPERSGFVFSTWLVPTIKYTDIRGCVSLMKTILIVDSVKTLLHNECYLTRNVKPKNRKALVHIHVTCGTKYVSLLVDSAQHIIIDHSVRTFNFQ